MSLKSFWKYGLLLKNSNNHILNEVINKRKMKVNTTGGSLCVCVCVYIYKESLLKIYKEPCNLSVFN